MNDELSINLWPSDLPAVSADIDVPESGPASMTVQVLGDARARARSAMSVSASWNGHTATYLQMTGIGGASVKRGLDGDTTTLKAWELQGAEPRLPELADYTITVQDGDKTRKFADLDGIVVAAAAAAGASINAPLPWAGYRVEEGTVSTLDKTLRQVVEELWGKLGYRIEYVGGQQQIVRRPAAADTIYPAPYDEEQIDILDDNVPVALVITGGKLKKDPVTGDIIGAPDLDTDPDSRAQGRNVDDWKPTITRSEVTDTTAGIIWTLPELNPVRRWDLDVATDGKVVQTLTTDGMSALVSDLNPGTDYSVRVRAVVRSSSAGGQILRTSNWSEVMSFTTLPARDFAAGADVLKNIGISTATASALTVKWTIKPAFTAKSIEIRVLTTAGALAVTKTVDAAYGHVTVEGLKSGTDYSVHARAVSSSGHLSLELVTPARTDDALPGSITNLQIVPQATTAAVSWTAAPHSSSTRVTLVQGYDGMLQVNDVPNIEGTGGFITLENLAPGTLYQIQLAGDGVVTTANSNGTLNSTHVYGSPTEDSFLTAEADDDGASLERVGLNITLTYVHRTKDQKGRPVTTTTSITREDGRDTMRTVLIEGSFDSTRFDGDKETTLTYTGKLTQTTTVNVYGLPAYPDTLTQAFTETIAWGPDTAHNSSARIETSRVTTTETRQYSERGLYLQMLTQSKVRRDAFGRETSAIRTETHVPSAGGLWTHSVKTDVIRPEALYDTDGNVIGYDTLIEPGLPQDESGSDRAPEQLKPVKDADGNTFPALASELTEPPAAGWSGEEEPKPPGASGFDEGGVASPVEYVPTYRLPLDGGTQAEVTVNFPWVTSPTKLRQLALLLAPQYLARQRIKRRYFVPVQASRSHPGVTSFSVRLEAGDLPTCEVTVTTEFPL